ncbi:MAG: response regulator [Alphaproteobacteria bacterium]|nr:response regulator [Alphaproteobacteria bacterium]
MVEDEPLISMLLEDMLCELGHEVPLVSTNVADALVALDSHSFDGAFLDYNLRGERADPVALSLQDKRIPFVLATGGLEDADSIGAQAVVPKPYRFDDIEQATRLFVDRSASD